MNDAKKDVESYSAKTAQLWKVESHDLLLKYKKDKAGFREILHSVVGKGSGVLRNVKKDDFPSFAEYVRKNLSKIESGEYDIFSVESFSGKKPTSFISKICHIVNPKDYPIIWDENVRKVLKVGSSRKEWQNKLEEFKSKQKCKTNEELYKIDSNLWAQGTSL